MAQLNMKEFFKNPTVKNTAIGIGVAVIVPIAATYLGPLIKPVARSTLKIGLVTVEKGRELTAELGEIFDDLVAEVRDEMHTDLEPDEGLLENTTDAANNIKDKSAT